ncbi:MAG: FHA domain-containing protein [Verrucomicrobiota bacterium]
MAETEIPEFLQIHGQAGETGCLSVTTVLGDYASIYLLEGEVVYAETAEDFGVTALFISMTWDGAAVTWEEGKQPPRLIMREPFDSLLFQYAQLEDAGILEPEAIRNTLGDNVGSTNSSAEVKLLDLSQYAISFEVLNTPFKGFSFYLEKRESLVGRLEDCDIILPDASLSSHHCKIVKEDNRIRVIDFGSTNGTRINSRIITEETLQVGDEFQIGAVLITMHVKLKRNLDQQTLDTLQEQASNKKAVTPRSTTKLDPKKLRSATDRVHGPITWKNLSSSQQKEKSKSLFGGLFKKK